MIKENKKKKKNTEKNTEKRKIKMKDFLDEANENRKIEKRKLL